MAFVGVRNEEEMLSLVSLVVVADVEENLARGRMDGQTRQTSAS